MQLLKQLAAREAGDWASPMLVKEMRRGTRSRAFTWVFLLLQGILLLSMLAVLFSEENVSKMLSGHLFWGLVNVWFLLVAPLRGMSGVAAELREGGFELVALTRFTAWRIVVGKWSSAIAENLLVMTTLLPYAVLRYFVGGVDIAGELLLLGATLLTSAFLTSVTILGGVYTSIVARGLAVGLCFVCYAFQTSAVVSALRFRQTGAVSLLPVLLALGLTILLTCFVLELAASRIAPPAENHALRKRLFALLLLGIGLWVATAGPEGGGFALLCAALPIYVCIDACGEPVHSIPGLYAPFGRRSSVAWSTWAKPLARLFYPGWPSGLCFSGVTLTLFAVGLIQLGPGPRVEAVVLLLALLAALLPPLALQRLLAPSSTGTWAWFWSFQAACLTTSWVAGSVGQFSSGGFDDIAALFPTTGLLLAASESFPDASVVSAAVLYGFLTLAALLILVAASVRPWREIRGFERQAGDPALAPRSGR